MSDHRPLPASREAECRIIAALHLCPKEIAAYCAERKFTAAKLHFPDCRTIFNALNRLLDDGKLAGDGYDLAPLTQYLHDTGRIAACGGVAGVTEICCSTPTAANIARDIEIAENKHEAREIIRICGAHQERAYSEQDAIPAVLDSAEREIMGIAASRHQDASQTTKELVMEAIHDIERANEAATGMKGHPTGLKDFDEQIGGIGPTDFWVIQAKRSFGKTSLALTIAAHLAIEQRIPVGYISLETPAKGLLKRLIAARAKVKIEDLLRGTLMPAEGLFGRTVNPFEAVTRAASAIADAPLHFEYGRGLTAQEIAAKARRMVSKRGVKVIFCDFLQKMAEDRKCGDKRSDRIAGNSLALSNLCGDLGIAVIVLSQENSEGTAFGSSEISNDADVLAAIHEGDEGIEIKVLKNRDGEKDQSIPVFFDRQCTAFRNKDEEPTKPPAPGAGKKATRSR